MHLMTLGIIWKPLIEWKLLWEDFSQGMVSCAIRPGIYWSETFRVSERPKSGLFHGVIEVEKGIWLNMSFFLI